MTVNIDYETEKELGIDYASLANQVADKVLNMEHCPYDAQINLVLTDNEEIKRVNTEFRNIQAPTDVLSFPMINWISSMSRTSLFLYFSRNVVIASSFPFLPIFKASISSFVKVSLVT